MSRGFGDVRKPTPGVGGVSGGITSIGQMGNLLRARFAPTSSVQVPLSNTGKPGNRNIAGIVVSTNLPLVTGGVVWTFPTPFLVMPSISITAFGAPPVAGTTLYILALSLTAVSVASTSNVDARQIHIIASGNPN
jgi:hypothetical protein